MSGAASAEVVLLRICADPDGDHASNLGALDEAEWARLAGFAEEHRVAPLVLRAVRRVAPPLPVPVDALGILAAADRWHRLNAMRQSAGIARLAGHLAAAGLRPLFLKGTALAFGACPDPALRPLRDVDLLLPPDEAARAQALLLGLEPYRQHPKAEHLSGQAAHQFQPLQDRDFLLTIEMHHRLGSQIDAGREQALIALLWAGAVPIMVGGAEVLVPSAPANVLHLVEHAACEHRFENGPITLADLHFLLAPGHLDQDDLVARAQALGLGHALALVAGLAQAHGARWPGPVLSARARAAEPFLAVSAAAMLQGHDEVERNKLLRRIDVGGRRGWGAVLARALRPDPKQIAMHAAGDARWRGYLRWAQDRGRRYSLARKAARAHANEGTPALMAKWLAEE